MKRELLIAIAAVTIVAGAAGCSSGNKASGPLSFTEGAPGNNAGATKTGNSYHTSPELPPVWTTGPASQQALHNRRHLPLKGRDIRLASRLRLPQCSRRPITR